MKRLMSALAATCISIASAADYREFIPETTEPNGEAVEWTTHYGYNTQDRKSPRVLLVGDSICNGYQGPLREILASQVNVSYWASSYCITHPQYLEMLDVVLRGPRPDVVLINNGLHTPPREDFAIWKAAYRKTLDFLRAALPGVPMAIINSTPLRDDAAGYVDRINAATAEVAHDAQMDLIDLHSMCQPWNRGTDWADRYHFIPEARRRQAEFLAQQILQRIAGKVTGKTIQQESEKGPDGKIK